MALTAAVATAIAALSAAAALGLPLLWCAVALVPGLALVATKPGRPLPRAGRHTNDLLILTALGTVAVVVAHPTPEDFPTVAKLVLAGVVPLSLLWPAPVVVKYCLLLSAGSLAGAGGLLTDHALAAAVLAVSAATALVALNRLATPTAVRRERVAGEAAALLLIAGLIGVLVATLLPPPEGGGGGLGDPGGGGSRVADFPPYLIPTDELDTRAAGTGKGNEIVFRVEAASSALWRTMTFDTYDGTVWIQSDEFLPEENEDFRAGPFTVPPGVGDPPGTGGSLLDQHVTIETRYVGALPAALRPVTVDAGPVYTRPDGTLQSFLTRGDEYDVTSRVPPTDPDVLARHDAGAAGVPFDVRRSYLGFPGVPARVTELATQITAGAAHEHAQVTAVQQWMQSMTEVKAGTRSLPSDADPLDQYLFVDRAGSSLQAATAAAILLRMVGVPTRLAVGYLPGDRSWVTGDFVVRERHAHAWFEAWFPEVGWVGFDPAGRFAGPEPAGDSLLDRIKRLWWVLLILVVLALAVIAWRVVAWRRRLRTRPWATQTYERLTRAGSRHGRPRQPAETPAEYCGALAGGLPDPRLVEVGALVTAATWSEHEPPAEARAWADEVVAATVRSAPRRRNRLRRRRRHGHGPS